MRVHTATTPLPAMTTLGRNPTPSRSTATLCPNKNMGTKTREMVDRLVAFQHMGKAGFSPLGATNRDGNPTNSEHHGRLLLVTSPSKCVCCHPIYSGRQPSGRTKRGRTGGRSNRISPPSFCDSCLHFFREKDSAVPFHRRP